MRFLSFSSTFATLVLSQSVASTVPADPASRACGEIVREANGSSTWFSASDAIACLQSVPFNAPIASRFLRYVNTTVQFQSSLEWLKDPPAEYQQIAIDVVGSFAQIQNRINTGYYQNQFQFESELQRVLYDTNDGHLTLFGGLFNVFTFSSERFVVSVSEDGVRLPKVYLAGDLRASARGGRRPSAISTINSQDVISYLTGFANKQTVGVVEPHAEWNQLFENPARDIQGADSAFGGSASFYPGDNVVFGFEDGTEKRYEFLARYYSPGPTGPLETGGDMFNFFVLGLYPASYVEEDATEDDSDEEVAPPDVIGASWSDTELSFAYPTANISQHNLGGEDGEVLTAYFLPGTSTAVLSIPSFAQSGDNIQSFTEVVENFTTRARELGSKRCIIDLQQNTGGDVSLAIDTFKRFFPSDGSSDNEIQNTHHVESEAETRKNV
ncbi:Peptidase family S41-like protein 2 [Elsinoe fawcettii]|nr:Peptidase family S41-like protein 2 [Elsinoe fawcettii]